jgi:F-box and WD-40 domain protein CDC4
MTRRCLAVLQGHTSLVGQLQMRGDILVTGGSDGSVRVWSLTEYQPIHRLAAHDNSVTSLQFDDTRIVSGGSDGRVKVWDLKKGTLVRELSKPADAVWRVVFEEEKAVIMASRNQKTIMEVSRLNFSSPALCPKLIRYQVWSFAPPEDELVDDFRSSSPVSMPDHSMAEYQDGATSRIPASISARPVSEDISMADVYDRSDFFEGSLSKKAGKKSR